MKDLSHTIFVNAMEIKLRGQVTLVADCIGQNQ